MRIKSKVKATVMAVALATLPMISQSAGLGRLNVLSGLGQPLRAEIDLVSVQTAEVESLRATLASVDSYKEAQIDYPPTSLGLRFNLDKRANGQYYIVVNSAQSVNEPFIDFLVELKWDGGRVLREYTALLDPVGYNPGANVVAPVSPVKSNPIAQPSPAKVVPVPTAPIAAAPAQSKPVAASKPEAAPKKAEAKPEAKPAVKSEPKDSPNGPTYTVKSGDTLAGVARMNMAEGVSLEQMLVGIYQANQGAFEGNNMNRLKKGEVLSIPTKDALASLTKEAATQEIKVQAEDWRAYRGKVADAATTSHADKAKGSEKITAKVEEKAKPAPVASKDTLKLSKGEDGKLKERVQSLEEEAAARQKALQEASQRVAELEKTNKKLEDLLALKSKQGAELQKQAAAKVEAKPADQKPVEVKPASKPVEPAKVEAPKVEAAKPVDAKPADKKPADAKPEAESHAPAGDVVKPTEAKKPETPVTHPKPKKAPVVIAAPEPETSLLDDPMVLGGGLLGLLGLGAGGFVYMRRRKKGNFEDSVITGSDLKSNTMVGNTGGAVISTGVTENSFLTDFSRAGLGTIDTDEVDPIAEAEVYMAYGRDAQAEEILKDALSRDGSRQEVRLKLLEIYSGRKTVAAFENTAQELYSATQGAGPIWAQAAEMGRALDPQNTLYQQQAPVDTGSLDQTMVMSVGTLGDTGRFDAPLASLPSDDGADLDFQLDSAEPTPEATPDADATLDFDLGFDAPTTTESSADDDILDIAGSDFDAEIPPPAPAPSADLGDDTVLDFDILGDLSSGETAAPASVTADDGILSLDIPLDMPAEQAVKIAEEPETELSMPDLVMPDLDAPVIGAPDVAEAGGALDFDFDLGDSPSLDVSAEPVLNLDGVSLDLDIAPEAADGGDVMDFGAELDDPVTTKIDLARAYIDMGDNEGAREILQEAKAEGTPEQKATADSLLAQL